MTRTSAVADPGSANATTATEAVAESTLRRAADRLTAATGLTFPRSRHANLRRALVTASSEAGVVDVDAFVDGLDRQPQLIDRLVSLATIGETYFFRHPEQLDVLSRRILPSVIAECASAGRTEIRVWCAGCSTGEEAYSLAILIEAALDARPGWEFRVAATDIDREALRRARTATYGRWSFRTDVGERGRWFEADGTRRRVRTSIVDHVTFSVDNLSLEEGGLPAGLGGQADLIVCRNVTMYLSDDVRRRVAARFLRALAPGGWLVVAPVELSSSVYAAFDTVLLDGLTFYRRPPSDAAGKTATQAGAIHARRAIPRDQAHGHRRSLPSSDHRSKARPGRLPRRDTATRIATARRLADKGQLNEARRESESAVREDPQSGGGYLLLASIADAQNDLSAAAVALRRAVYLDRADPTVQFRLGLVEWRLGRKRQARARLATALGLVEGRGEEETLDESSDLTVGRLRNTVELLADG